MTPQLCLGAQIETGSPSAACDQFADSPQTPGFEARKILKISILRLPYSSFGAPNLFNEHVANCHVRLGAEKVIVGHKILNGVIGKEVAKLVAKLWWTFELDEVAFWGPSHAGPRMAILSGELDCSNLPEWEACCGDALTYLCSEHFVRRQNESRLLGSLDYICHHKRLSCACSAQ